MRRWAVALLPVALLRLALLPVAALAGVALAAASAALAAQPRDALTHSARLQGAFVAHGTVVRAVNVPGERVGQHVTRMWQFVPACPAGACATVRLVRQRASGTDTLRLRRRRPGYYVGKGSFSAPVRCGRRLYRAGELARYTITLTITSAIAQGTSVIATGFTATYQNPSRLGLTRCVMPPTGDKARYVGAPAPAAPAGSTRRVRSARSSTGS